jgi:hypothetical protein
LADAPAFGLALTGCFFIWKGIDQQKRNWFMFSFLFFLLGGLIKISSLIILIAIFIVHIYLIFFSKKGKGVLYKWYFLIPYLVVLSVMFAWYNFAIQYNHKNISGIFLTEIYPIWDIDALTRKHIWTSLINDLLPSYLNKVALYLILSLYIALFFFYRKINKVLLFLNILVFIGVTAYILLFYQAFTVHDYYLINLLIFVPLPLIAMVEMLKRDYPFLLKNSLLKIISIVLLLFLVYQTAIITRMKYSTDDWFVRNSLVSSKSELDYWSWYHSDYENHLKAFATITPYLRSLGIERSDKVLSLPDASPNISLYLMDQKGYTAFGYNDIPFEQKMLIYKKNGVKYLIIDSVLNEKLYLKPYLNDQIGMYRNIRIFKLDRTGL